MPMVSKRPLGVRFWPHVAQVGNVCECWDWTASLDGGGYGQIRHLRRTLKAHRVAYQLVRGSIPHGLHLDHLCRNRRCVNPWHLEAVTSAENTKRGGNAIKTECPAGHPLTPENTYVHPVTGWRRCQQCHRDEMQRRRSNRHAD